MTAFQDNEVQFDGPVETDGTAVRNESTTNEEAQMTVCSACEKNPVADPASDGLCDPCWKDREWEALPWCGRCCDRHSLSEGCSDYDGCSCGGRGVCPVCDPGEWFTADDAIEWEMYDAEMDAAQEYRELQMTPDETPTKEDGAMQSYIGKWWIKAHRMSWVYGEPKDGREFVTMNVTEPTASEARTLAQWSQVRRDADYTEAQARKYSYRDTRRKSATVNSPEPMFVKKPKATSTRWTPKQMQTDGWTSGERALNDAQQDLGAVVQSEYETEAQREARMEREMIEHRAFKVSESFRSKVARTWMLVADKQTNPKTKKPWTNRDASKRIWGLGQAEARIIEELRQEWNSVEERKLSDDEILALQEAVQNDEDEAQQQLKDAPRKADPVWGGSETDNEAHQRLCESEMMTADAKVAWVAARTQENEALLQASLKRYFTEFGPKRNGEYNNDSLFPMWQEDADGKWKLVQKTLSDIWTQEKAKRGGEVYKAMWTMHKMVDSRYEAQLKYARKQRKAKYNSNLVTEETQQENGEWFDAMVASR